MLSSQENVDEAIEIYRVQNGFKGYPIDCFKVEEYELNDYSQWETHTTHIMEDDEWQPGNGVWD